MFSYRMIDDVYDIMLEEAYDAEQQYMENVKRILRYKTNPTAMDKKLLGMTNSTEFFNLLLNGYNNTKASATVNAYTGTYTVEINGQTETYTATGADKQKIDDCLKQGKDSEAAGHLFELAAKPILTNIMDQLIDSIGGDKITDTSMSKPAHVNRYDTDYVLTYYYTKDGDDSTIYYQHLFNIEEKAKLSDFHVANAQNNGILNVQDYKNYMTTNPKEGIYDVFDYIQMKLVQEKLRKSYPIFHSVNNKDSGVLMASTMLNSAYNFYLQNYTMPSDTEVMALAKEIIAKDSQDTHTDMMMFSPYVLEQLAKSRKQDAAMKKFTDKILDRVVKNAAKGSGIKGFQLWYGKRF